MSPLPLPPTFRPPRLLALATVIAFSMPPALAQSATLSISSEDYTLAAVRSDISLFAFDIELDVPLVAGTRYENPPVLRMDYRVVGELDEGTPSEFERFDLQREFEGDAFYAQGSSLVFTVSPSAVLDDGVQIAELAGDAVVLSFDGREIGTGRFHPARLELRADGTGRLQNSDNQPGEDAASAIAAGAEYVTDLAFDPGNVTVLRAAVDDGGSSSGGGAAMLAVVILPWSATRRRRRRRRGATGLAPPDADRRERRR